MTIAQQLRNLYDNLVIAINFINEGINLKADKVSSATSGNLAGLDSTGNLTDSGKKASDFAAKEETIEVASSVSAQELAPNTLYVFESRSAALTLTLGTPITGIANEYHFFLICDDTTAPTVTWPTGITWNGGSAPTIAAAKTYEVSILNDVAAYFETDNPVEESESV